MAFLIQAPVLSRQTAVDLLLERFFAASRFLVLDSQDLLENIGCRALVVRKQASLARFRAGERAS